MYRPEQINRRLTLGASAASRLGLRMSFGYSIGDGILLVQLAWKTLQGARQACGEHDELTREVVSLHRVLQRLQKELSNPDSLLNRADDDRRQELNEHGRGCVQILNIMNSIVTKYNKLSESGRSAKRIWQKVKFGNGEIKDLSEILGFPGQPPSSLNRPLYAFHYNNSIKSENRVDIRDRQPWNSIPTNF